MALWQLQIRGCFISRREGLSLSLEARAEAMGRTEPLILGIDSAALTYFFSCSWLIIYRAEGGWQLLGRWGVQEGGQSSVSAPSCHPQGGREEARVWV